MRKVFQYLKAAVPITIKNRLRENFYRLTVPGYSSAPVIRPLTQYLLKRSQVATWSPDHQLPHGTVLERYYLPHFLLARSVIKVCCVNSWCDLGSGVGSLSLAVARLGVDNVIAIEGSDIALCSGLVRFPHSNYFIADVTQPIDIYFADGTPAEFDLVSALELLEHIPEEYLDDFFDNIRRMNTKFLLLSIGLQPDPPYHVNLKSMREWMQRIYEGLQYWEYDDNLSQQVFRETGKHVRFKNNYPTNIFPEDRNLLIFVRR